MEGYQIADKIDKIIIRWIMPWLYLKDLLFQS